jgi:hypothetical protein
MNFMEMVRKYDRCEWCGRDRKKNRRGLCRSCDTVRRQLDSLEAQTQGKRNVYLDWELRVTKQMKKDCIAWGNMLKPILGGAVTPLKLEHDFRHLARNIAGDDKMFVGWANILADQFDSEQCHFLAYLFWQIYGEQASHNRRNRASRHRD